MALYPDHYKHDEAALETETAQTEHCLETLRQHVMCYGSTTLVPTKWRASAEQQYIDSNQEHVCRDFSHLRNFVRMRSMEGDLYVPRDKSLLSKAKSVEGELKTVEGDHAA